MSDVQFELAVERYIDAAPEIVWKVWTEQLTEWWAPKPWTTQIIEHDLRPGGRSAMLMRGPDGASAPLEGVVLEVVPNERVVFTDAFGAGWIPKGPFMVGIFTMRPHGAGTWYRACARHWNESAMRQHEAMGFTQGWGVVADQLAALAEAAAGGHAR